MVCFGASTRVFLVTRAAVSGPNVAVTRRALSSTSGKMSRQLSPLALFGQTEGNVAIWVNGDVSAERPVWTSIWNGARRRYCADGGANVVAAKSDLLKAPDVVCGDFDSIIENVKKSFGANTKIISTPDQEHTDLTKCLEIVLHESEQDQQVKRIVVLGGLSGRLDHTLATFNSLLNATRKCGTRELYAVDGVNLAAVLLEGTITLDMSERQKLLTGKCGIVPFCQQATKISLSGFQWNLENADTQFGAMISTSNEIASDAVMIKCTQPVIFTVELSKTCLGL